MLIKGWGVATLLRDLPQVISVRVCAPMAFRVRVLMERLNSADAKVVREEIERHDAVRTRTMATYFNVKREDARLYHIVLNTGMVESMVRSQGRPAARASADHSASRAESDPKLPSAT